MKGYKAYDNGLICRGKQYKVDEIFEESRAEICECGMHYCDNPADLMTYHDIVDDSGELMNITEVEDLAPESTDSKQDECSKKYCTTKLKIGAQIKFGDWVRASVEFLINRTKKETEEDDSGDYAQLAASGDSAKLAASGYYAKLAASGDSAQLAASGDSAKLAASGDSAKLAASGYYAKLAASGYYAKLAASGDSAKLAASGDYAKLAASGDYAQLAASGDYAKLAASGEDSVIAAIGINNTAKGVVGTWLTLAEWKYDNEKKRYIPVCVKTEKIDGDRLKADTWYRLKNGEFTEVKL